MRKLGWIGIGLVFIVGLMWWAVGADWRRLILSAPTNADVLFWRVDQRDAGFRMMDRVPFLIDAREIDAAANPEPLKVGPPLQLDFDLEAYMEQNRSAGIVVLQDGILRLEAYGLDFDATGRWTSFSVAKSVTSTLVGAAVKDGFIKSLEDPVSDYIEGLKGSAYDQVSVEQLLTMSSGVAWNEDYEDPNSDVAKFNTHIAEDGLSNLVSYMRALPRAHPAGTVWNYSTGETNMIGVLVREATGRNLSDYLAEKIWQPYGMQQDASWLLNADGTEISGCCIQAATRDFARFGQFILEGAQIDGVSIVPDDWLDRATTTRLGIGREGAGYGYQWWTFESGVYVAYGIFGQAIYIDPERRLVIASNSSWKSAIGRRDGEETGQEDFHAAIAKALDREQAQTESN